MMQRMAAWLVYRAVLSAPVAVRPVQAITALESPTLGIRMAASAETIDGLSLAGRKSAVRVVGGEVSLDWVGGRGEIHCSLRSPAGVLPRFFSSLVFSQEEGRIRATGLVLPVAVSQQRKGQR
jgi:hypothetical protein